MNFVTICVQNPTCLFGKITDREMILNEYGQIAHNEWAETSEIRSNVELDVFVVMPNHIHGIPTYCKLYYKQPKILEK